MDKKTPIQFSQEQLDRWKREDRADLLLAVGLSILMVAVCIVGIYWSFA